MMTSLPKLVFTLMPCFISIIAAVTAVPAADTDIATASRKLKIYGNWCGPKHGSGTPKDALDAACKVHDLCYDNYGYFNCKCDVDLVRTIEGLNSQKLRLIGAPIKAFFKQNPCKGPVKRPTWCRWRPCIRCKPTWILSWAKRFVKKYKC